MRKKKVDSLAELDFAPTISKPISENGFGFHSVLFIEQQGWREPIP